GLVLSHSVRFNVTLPNLLRFGWLLLRRREAGLVQTGIERLGIRLPSSEVVVENLSGGNQQKVVLAKWLVAQPRLLVLDEPTRGVDVGAKAEISERMHELTRQAMGTAMAASELPQLIGTSDRTVVLHEGRQSGELTRAEATEQAVMQLATGVPTAVVA